MAIRTFADKETRRLFEGEFSKGLPADIARSSLRKLAMLDAAASLADLQTFPGSRLERLHGDRAEQYSLRINDQWRLCFEWREGNAYEVEIVDYH